MRQKPLVALDLRPAQENGVGVATVGQQIIKHLPALERRFRLLLVFDGRKAMDNITVPADAEVLQTSVGRSDRWRRDVYDQILLPRHLARAGVALFHNIDFGGPCRRVPFCTISSFMDPGAFHPLDQRGRIAKARMRTQMRLLARRVDAVLTISDFSLHQLVAYLPTVRGKIHRIWCSVDDVYFRPPTALALERCRHRLQGTSHQGFVLYYGGFSRRKNVGVLLEAFARSATPVPLVIVGEGQGADDVRHVAAHLGVESRVHFYGFASLEDLRALLSLASVMVFPSLWEGFGLPAAEAMAAGVPVLLSSAGPLPEVGGDAAQYFVPSDAMELARLIDRVLADEGLRRAMGRRGSERARSLFDGSAMIERYGDLYERVLRIAPSGVAET